MTTALATSADVLDVVRVKRQRPSLGINPQWRYLKAKDYSTFNIKFFKRSEDVVITKLTTFLNKFANVTEGKLEALEDEYPEYYWAHLIFTQAYKGPRFYIEALSLAGQTQELIAEFVNLPIEVISCYESCYFDVREQLENQCALRIYIDSLIRERSTRDLDPDAFWKKMALDGGINALMALWNVSKMDANDKELFDELIIAQKRKNAFMAEHIRTVRGDTANEIAQEYLELKKYELDKRRLEAETNGELDHTQEILGALYSAVQFTPVPPGLKVVRATELTESLPDEDSILNRLQGSAIATAKQIEKKASE